MSFSFVIIIDVVLGLVNHVIGLVVISPVMEVEVVSSIPVRSGPLVLPGKLQAQLWHMSQ